MTQIFVTHRHFVVQSDVIFILVAIITFPVSQISTNSLSIKPTANDTKASFVTALVSKPLIHSPGNKTSPTPSYVPPPKIIILNGTSPPENGSSTNSADVKASALFPISNQPHPATLRQVPSRDNGTLTFGYLVVERARNFVPFRLWKIVSGALSYAVERINEQGIVPGYNLDFVVRDTRGQTNDSLMAMSEMWKDDVVAFFGPANECKNEAMLAGAWNLPILSHICSDDAVSDKKEYPTFARTFPPAVQITKSVVSLLNYYNWTKFSIIYGETESKTYQSVAMRLKSLGEEYNMTINHMVPYKEPHLVLVAGNPFPKIIQDTYVDTRIYVFLGYLNALVDLMINMDSRGLLDTGMYMVVYVEFLEHIASEPRKYFKRTYDIQGETPNYKGARSLLVVKPSPHEDIEEFHNSVREYNGKLPFNFRSPVQWKKVISVHASYLYDAAMLYATALREVLLEGGSYLDGKAIASKIFGRTYRSIQGYLTKIDKNGNAEGNYTVLSFQPNLHENASMPYAMLPVANFRLSEDGELPIYHPFKDHPITWLSGSPPLDEPVCGYRNRLCESSPSHLSEIVGGVVGGIAFVTAIVMLLVYRNWRYEQEIAGLLWKLDASAIHCSDLGVGKWDKKVTTDDNENATTECGISMVSMESKNSFTQVYTYIGKFKGQTVALKTFNINSYDLTRRDKMEMKLMRDLRHTNVNNFIGACLESSVLTLVTAYCCKGSLQDVLENDDLKLDETFLASLVKDLIQGMMYVHSSDLGCHGNLKSSNCVVTSRWTLQVADLALLDIRRTVYSQDDVYIYYRNLLWTAPEMVRSGGKLKGSQQADVYAFAIILHEIYGRMGPFGNSGLDPREIVTKVTNYQVLERSPYRPEVTWLTCDDYIKQVMTDCWAEQAEGRPDFSTVWYRLKPMRSGIKRNIFDHMLSMMEKYQEHLEELVDERTEQLSEEKKKTETLLYRMLPRSVADHLKKGEAVQPEAFDSVTIYFSDICGFTSLSADSTPMQIVDMLNDLYTCFDSIIKNFDVYKVETIGDAYMVASGLPLRNGDRHAGEVASMSLALLRAIRSFTIRHKPEGKLKLRIGIHSGPCVAGVVGLTMPRFTLFGDTVNTASRMESNGEALRIHCSTDCRNILDKIGGFYLEERGYIAMKGKGNQLTYWLNGEDPSLRPPRQFLTSSKGDIPMLENTPRSRAKRDHMHAPQQQSISLQPSPCHNSLRLSQEYCNADSSSESAIPKGQFLGQSLKDRLLKSPRSSASSDLSRCRRSDTSLKPLREQYASLCDSTPTEVTTLLTDYVPCNVQAGTHV